MPERKDWRKVRDKDAGIGKLLMEENTDTIPIPILDIERKTLPVFCPWCDVITGVAKANVIRFSKISPAYKACRKCADLIIEIRIPSDHGMGSIREFLNSLGLLPVSRLKVFEKWNASVNPSSSAISCSLRPVSDKSCLAVAIFFLWTY